MAIFCTNCGKELAEGTAFCTECGTKAPEAAAAQIPQAAVPQQTYTPPVQTSAPAPAAFDPKSQVVGTSTFFGLQFLFSIPVIGWIACALQAFTATNKNIKNYARAMLIWLLIGAVLSAGLFFAVRLAVDAVAEALGDLTGILDSFGGSGELTDLLGQLSENGELGDLTELLDQLGESSNWGDLNDLPD